MPKLLSTVVASVALAVLIPATTASSASCWDYSKNDRAFKNKINDARAAKDRPKLRLDPELSRVALKQTRAMVKEGFLHHTPNLGKRVTRWDSLGENVGYGGTVESLHKAFMASPGHKANILAGKYRFVGVAAKKSGNFLWVTVVFEGKRNPGTTLNMPKC